MKKNISVYRGNSVALQVNPYINGDEVVLGEDDQVIVTVRKYAGDEEHIIQKIATADNYDSSGRLVVLINPEDTANVKKQSLIYDCALKTSESFVTFVEPSEFLVKESISRE